MKSIHYWLTLLNNSLFVEIFNVNTANSNWFVQSKNIFYFWEHFQLKWERQNILYVWYVFFFLIILTIDNILRYTFISLPFPKRSSFVLDPNTCCNYSKSSLQFHNSTWSLQPLGQSPHRFHSRISCYGRKSVANVSEQQLSWPLDLPGNPRFPSSRLLAK